MLQRPIIQILLSLSLSASLIRAQEQVQQPLNTTFDINDCSKSKYYSPNYMAGTYSTTERTSLFYHACAHGDIEGDTSACCSHSEDLGTCVLYVGGYPAYDCFFEEEDLKGNSTEIDLIDTDDNSPKEIESDDTDDDYFYPCFLEPPSRSSTFTLSFYALLITAISVAVLLVKKRCTNQKGRVHVLDNNSIQSAIPVSAISSVDIQPVSYTKSHDTENELV